MSHVMRSYKLHSTLPPSPYWSQNARCRWSEWMLMGKLCLFSNSSGVRRSLHIIFLVPPLLLFLLFAFVFLFYSISIQSQCHTVVDYTEQFQGYLRRGTRHCKSNRRGLNCAICSWGYVWRRQKRPWPWWPLGPVPGPIQYADWRFTMLLCYIFYLV